MATANTIKIMIPIAFPAAKPLGDASLSKPVTCRIIPIKPMIEPPAIKPEERLTPLWILLAFNASHLVVLSTINLSNAPTKMIEVVEIGK